MIESEGWLLDLFEDEEDGLALWFLADGGERLRLRQDFPVVFYVGGPPERLREVWRHLRGLPGVSLARQERKNLFQEALVPVLAAEVQNPARLTPLFHQLAHKYPELDYYDTDVQLSLRYTARYGVYPTGRCRVVYDEENWVQSIEALESCWNVDPTPPPLRILSILPDCDPRHAPPRSLTLQHERQVYTLSLDPPRPLLLNLAALLRRIDPDLVITGWGDTWLLPYLLDLSAEWKIPLPFNREEGRVITYRKERSYFSYGQVIYRGQQVHLFGRWHIDVYNAVMYHDYELEGIWELARITSLPVQTTARVSPGTGISSMQILTALRGGVLVPWHKQQAETPVSALDLMSADQGGLVYQPLIGLHRDVAEVDFVSMYPSIMAHFNISPETVGGPGENTQKIASLNLYVNQEKPGLVPLTLTPLLEKRIHLKGLLLDLPRWHPQRKRYKACVSAHKWLLVTCFGYLGYKNARFGRIEAHESVTAYGRECLLTAKECAEGQGYTVLHMYVDGLWVQRDGARTPADVQPLLNEILDRTGLPIALDGIYRWVVFLPSRMDARVPVANRYFGVFQDGSLKYRGIEARRHDTPAWIARLQLDMLEALAQAESVDEIPALLPGVLALLKRRLDELRQGRVPVEGLLVSQTLSRTLEEYRVPSPAARAVRQLEEIGKRVVPGQRVRFLYTLGKPGVYAWDLPEPPDPLTADLAYYRKLALAAAATVLPPLDREGICDEVLTGAPRQLRLWHAGSGERTRRPRSAAPRIMPPGMGIY